MNMKAQARFNYGFWVFFCLVETLSITVRNGVTLLPKGNICLSYIRQYSYFKIHPHNIFCQQTGFQQGDRVLIADATKHCCLPQ